MRRRLYFILPSVDLTRRVVDELLLARIDHHHIHVLAREGLSLDDLPEATLLQRSDLVHGVELGLVVGGATGLAAGAIAVFVSAVTAHVSWGLLLLLCALAGALIGAWAASMIGTSTPNSNLRRFQPAIDAGQILLMVDVPKEQVQAVRREIQRHHPEADIQGVEPTIPAFP